MNARRAAMNSRTLGHGDRRAARPYTVLWLMLALALLPLLAAWVSYFGAIGLPEARVNRGDLVLDQPQLQRWQLRTTDGNPWRGGGQWQLLQLAAECGADCDRWRRDLLQLHKALGRERPRVALHWVNLAPPSGAAGLGLRRMDASVALAPGIWLADPLGNPVLYYRFDQSPRDLLLDLKRLLKVSKVG